MNAAGETVRELTYYPFGMVNEELSSADTTGYDFLFTGKEWIGELGIDLYDYGARYLDPELGRWGAVDPMAEKYVNHSPYNGILNNPFNGVDLFGMEFIHRDPHNNAEETIKILNFINYWEIQGNPKIEWYTAIWDYLDADGKLPNRVRIGNTFSILIEAPCYGMGTPSPQYEMQDPWEAYLEAVDGAIKRRDEKKYKPTIYHFKKTYISADPDEDLLADFSPTQFIKGTVSIIKHPNGRYYVEAFAETYPGGLNGYVIAANLRVIRNDEEIGFQYLSMNNEWGSNLYNANWTQLGFARLYLPKTGNVVVQMSVFSYKNRFWKGSTLHTLYQGQLSFTEL